MARRVINIDIVSDTICPFCFLGKRRLEKGFKLLNANGDDVGYNITWHPYQLDPGLPKEGIPKLQYYEQKFGKEAAKRMPARMIATGQEDGVQFKYDGAIVANTLDSHRLINYVQKRGDAQKTNELVEELFTGHFENAKHIGDHGALADVAAKVGFNRSEVLAYLASDAGREEVVSEISSLSRRGIRGVPHITFEKKYVVSGAQPPEVFAELIGEILEKA
ncbi:thioredoxin-like protein [Gonapodya prolifera JEL478]|uniref:Thioredoxin-like protein n=1 Tax=Gonapodya prolifera (strain JEL478) TaxID=1344416 RepID=A0A139AQA4_GONPJ|nr:thioredoxin-like protein [Gonapodya prolifera JEL478]|eukprot:KXS18916.1 thioredoxin-like protein [Gonapodya prolifera JEL478]